MEKRYIHESIVLQDTLDRINRLAKDSKPLWGKMNAGQMLNHCLEIQRVMNGGALKNTPFFIKLIKRAIKKVVLGTTPYRKKSPTHPQYLMTSESDFEENRSELFRVLEEFKKQSKEEVESIPHPLLGKLTHEEKSWGCYKHLDYHLKQFAV